jgi:hypothetical protein
VVTPSTMPNGVSAAISSNLAESTNSFMAHSS